MRPARVVRAVNWRHAIGELLLIVVGILIALAISDWNDRRIERQQELALLEEVRTALATDLQSLETNLLEFRAAAVQIGKLSDLLEEKPPYDPSMDVLFGALYGIRTTNLNTWAYETLKDVGLQVVTNKELRLGIARIYDQYYESMDRNHEIENSVNFGLMRPYFMHQFSDLAFWRSATPIDYDFVVNDPWFKNVVDYRLAVLEGNQLTTYLEATDEIRNVLELLDAELTD